MQSYNVGGEGEEGDKQDGNKYFMARSLSGRLARFHINPFISGSLHCSYKPGNQ